MLFNWFCRRLPASLDEFNPDMVVYNAGTDVLIEDPLGQLDITPEVWVWSTFPPPHTHTNTLLSHTQIHTPHTLKPPLTHTLKHTPHTQRPPSHTHSNTLLTHALHTPLTHTQGVMNRDQIVFSEVRKRNIPIFMITSGGYQVRVP